MMSSKASVCKQWTDSGAAAFGPQAGLHFVHVYIKSVKELDCIYLWLLKIINRPLYCTQVLYCKGEEVHLLRDHLMQQDITKCTLCLVICS